MAQIHGQFTDEQVKEMIGKYVRKEVGRKHLQDSLWINKIRFFALAKAYRDNPLQFSVKYTRRGKTNALT